MGTPVGRGANMIVYSNILQQSRAELTFFAKRNDHLQSADVFTQQGGKMHWEWVCAGGEGLKIGRV